MNKGIDVSKWDTNLDWSKYDWPFAFIKVSEGSVIDPLFDYHWVNARGKTRRGGYHFFRAYVNPEFAVGRFVEYLDGDYGELPPVLDLESKDGIAPKTVVSRALTWLIEVEKITNITPIVYSSPSFISSKEEDGGLELQQYPDFARYPLWLAQYPFDKIYPGYTEAMRAAKLKSILDNPSLLPIPEKPKPFVSMPYFQWTAKLNPADVPGCYTGTGAKLAVDGNFEIEPMEPEPSRADVRIQIRSVT